MTEVIKLKDAIKFDPAQSNYVIAEEFSQTDVDELLRSIAYETMAGYDLQETHELLAQNILEPIRQSVPYTEMYRMFFTEHPVGELEDPAYPIEDLPVIVWETHRDGEIMFVRANYRWTRPEFTTYDTGIEVQWDDLRRAGWNYLARQMMYATEELARKRDADAKTVLDAAIVSGQNHSVSGGSLTRASLRAVIKAAVAIGFPMTQCLVNSGTIIDVGDDDWPEGFSMPEAEQRELLTNLYLGQFGRCNFYTNPHAEASTLYFSGPPAGIGWHMTRGTTRSVSDIDIRKKVDLHAILDQDHTWVVGNAYNLRTLTITA